MKKLLKPIFKTKRLLNTRKMYDKLIVEAITICANGNLSELQEFVKNSNVDLKKTDYDLRSPLHLAVEEGKS